RYAMPVGAPAHRLQRSGMAGAHAGLPSRVSVPHTDALVGTPADQSAPVRGPTQRTHIPSVTTEGRDLLPGFGVPHPDGAVLIARTGEAPAVRAPLQHCDSTGVPAEGSKFLTRLWVPELDRVIRATAGEMPAIGTPAHGYHPVPVSVQRE